ncbi:MAG: aminotransferase class V-fold PLP-dependent enzyme [Pseudomonadota bacterium]
MNDRIDDPIYLDHNATTPVHADVFDAMAPYLRDGFGNPSSGHVFGARAKAAIEHARAAVAALLGCAPEEVVFTSGGTESNNLSILGLAAAHPERRHVVTSAVEHPATRLPCAWLQARGYEITALGVDGEGRVEPAAALAALRDDTLLLTLMLANNETGSLQPVAEISGAAHAVGAIVHTDAAQAVGKIPTRVDELGVDLLSVAGHKLYAAKGIGALYVRGNLTLAPMLLGGGQERGISPGTENVPHIVGLGRACEIAAADLEAEGRRQRVLTERLWSLLAEGVPGMRRNGPADLRLPNTLNVSFPGTAGSALLARADGLAASTGSACHEGHENPSMVLTAMGLSREEALGAVRLSVGRSTTEAQVDAAAEMLLAAWKAS